MNFTGTNFNSCGCGGNEPTGCPTCAPTYQQCNQVVQTCNVEDVWWHAPLIPALGRQRQANF